jgi:hypothetical protein
MTAFLNDRVLDNGLTVLDTEVTGIHYCSSLPSDYAGTLTASLGNKTGISVGSPAARSPSGRKVTVAAVTNGSATASGTITHYALVDSVNSRLLAAQTVAVSKVVNNGDTITSPAFDIGIPGP